MEKTIDKIKEYLKEQQELQQDKKPLLDYTRNQSWDGQPCKFCGSKIGIREVGGRYVSGYAEDNNLIFFCGKCLKILEDYFETSME